MPTVYTGAPDNRNSADPPTSGIYTVHRENEKLSQDPIYHHRFDINNDRGTSVAKHFILDDHTSQHVNIIAIDQLPGSDNISLLNKETHWIHTLGTTEPHGMNIKEQESFPISIRFK
ncbi:hypothetical protein ElyMa_001954600 [Elysia marginata]|uniref:Cadherin domain-containing protein n=1 Tax=Elysia marginata TaxID=1093978 RepID=A0AAV4EXY1_9GAST|nr:hypothetical protein ElyMa_001954600 [Elysia marginata]